MKILYDEYFILKLSLVVLVFLILISGPSYLLFIFNKNFSVFNIFLTIFLSLYLLFVISIAITSFIFDTVLLKLMGGKRIENRVLKSFSIIYLIMTMVCVLFFWLTEVIGLFTLACLFALNFVIYQEKKLLLSSGYIILGSRIIGMENVKAYDTEDEEKALGIKRKRINLHLRNNKILNYSGDSKDVSLFIRFLQEQNVEKL